VDSGTRNRREAPACHNRLLFVRGNSASTRTMTCNMAFPR
jgi:hypothetical protein